MSVNYKNLGLNDSERNWLLKVRSTLSKPKKKIIVPTNEIWYTSSDGEIITPIEGSYGDATIISNTYEDVKGVIKFDRDVTSIGKNAFLGCTGLTTITIPNSVTSIGESAFEGCTGLTSIDISCTFTSIGNYAFRGCTGLTSITIPNSVTSIGNSAFYGCTGLTSITIPNSVTSIGYGAFLGCTGLTSINILNTTPPTLGSNAFSNTNNCPIYVPSESVNTYKTASRWSTYASRIQAIQ